MDDSEGREIAHRAVGGATVRVVQGDLTEQRVDAVVNAANERLAHGGGVAAALAGKGGAAVQEESDRWVREHGPVRAGQAAVTTAGDLPAGHLVHVVGPRYRDDQDNAALLRQAVEAALDAAADLGAQALALPAISTGVFGYPRDEATRVIVEACTRWLDRHHGTLTEVRLVGFDEVTAMAFAAAL